MKHRCTYASHGSRPGKVWHFLWHVDSWKSFLADAILIILIGKFLLYPAVGVVMGNDYPIVAVVSGSMDHHGMDFDEWWAQNGAWYEQNGISKVEFEQFYLKNGFEKGDMLFIRSSDNLKVGDTIVYNVPDRSDPIIHRMIYLSDDGSVSTKGDANLGQLGFEINVSESQIYGKSVLLVPKLGWVKVGFYELKNWIF